MYRLFLTVLLLAALPAQAQVYKWVDENGKVHYSDQPQDGATTVDVESKPVIENSAGPTTEEINRRIKHTNQRLGAKRVTETNQQDWQRKQERRRQESNKKTCQYYKDKLANLEYRWKLQNSKRGYKESQKNRYLAKKDQYRRDIKRNCG